MKNAGKACNNRLYRHIRTFEKIVKNYFVISPHTPFLLLYKAYTVECAGLSTVLLEFCVVVAC